MLFQFAEFVGDVEVTAVTLVHVLDFGHGGATGRACVWESRRVLRSFFSWLRRSYGLPTLDPERITIPKYHHEAWGYLTQAELDEMRRAIVAIPCEITRRRDLALFELLRAAGLRRTEITTIKVTDLYLQDLRVRVYGKGGKYRLGYLTPLASNTLAEYITNNLHGKSSNSILFPISGNAVYERVRAWSRAVGIEKAHPHMFRKSLATHLRRSGADTYTIMRVLGHEKIDTTLRYLLIDDTQIQQEYSRYLGNNQRFTFEHTEANQTLIRAEVFCAESVNIEKARRAMQAAVDNLLVSG